MGLQALTHASFEGPKGLVADHCSGHWRTSIARLSLSITSMVAWWAPRVTEPDSIPPANRRPA